MSALAPTLQAYFTERLITQRNSSPRTDRRLPPRVPAAVAFAQEQTGKQPFELDIARSRRAADRRVPQTPRKRPGQQPRTRNARLAAIHSFYRFAALEHPEHAAHDRAGDGDPHQAPRAQHRQLPRPDEIRRCSPRPDRPHGSAAATTRCCSLMIQTGVRVSELTGLRVGDVAPRQRARTSGSWAKGRKRRATPLTGETVSVVRAWLKERQGAARRAPVPDPARTTAQPLHRRRDRRKAHQPSQSPAARHFRPSASPRTRSDITWTAGLCGRLGRFRWWAWRWGRFRPHNPGVVRVNGRLVGVSDRIRAFLPDAGFLARSSVGGRLLTP